MVLIAMRVKLRLMLSISIMILMPIIVVVMVITMMLTDSKPSYDFMCIRVTLSMHWLLALRPHIPISLWCETRS